jgi:16S rRNA (cytosine1402-N4)-methyltransferase
MERGASHRPVLLAAVAELLSPAGRRVLVDCTVGLGGHAEALLEAAGPQGRLIGIDVDEGNLTLARERLARFGERVRLFRANFTEVDVVLREAGVEAADAVLADLGVSSNQLEDASRGLSFQADGPLDMRLDGRLKRTAAKLIDESNEGDLADVIYRYGQERYSRRIARAIVAARRQPGAAAATVARGPGARRQGGDHQLPFIGRPAGETGVRRLGQDGPGQVVVQEADSARG